MLWICWFLAEAIRASHLDILKTLNSQEDRSLFERAQDALPIIKAQTEHRLENPTEQIALLKASAPEIIEYIEQTPRLAGT